MLAVWAFDQSYKESGWKRRFRIWQQDAEKAKVAPHIATLLAFLSLTHARTHTHTHARTHARSHTGHCRREGVV